MTSVYAALTRCDYRIAQIRTARQTATVTIQKVLTEPKNAIVKKE